ISIRGAIMPASVATLPPASAWKEDVPDTPIRPPRIDGRRLRSERTKQLIIEAFLSLLRETTNADGGADRRARGLFRALDLRALSRSQCAPGGGDRLQPCPGPGARAAAWRHRRSP